MWLRQRIGAAVVVAFVVLPSALARADKLEDSPFLWATVNVCDTANAPNTIGIRGSMPSRRDGRETLWMRFQVQYYSELDQRWHYVTDGGDSGFVPVGTARNKPRQGGRSFRIDPSNGLQVTLRGRVSFEWRLKNGVVRRTSMRTRRGFESSAGADPPGYTAATCAIIP